MGLFGKKKSDTIDFTRMSDARIPAMNKDYKFEGDAVDLRQRKFVSQQSESPGLSSGDVVDPFAGVDDSSSGSSSSSNSGSGGMFGFLDSSSTGSSQSVSPYPSRGIINEVSEVSELKTNMRKMSTQIEDHSNEVYRMMQRIELLEKKLERLEGR